jgi:predicted Zn-dependent protease
MSQVIDPSLPRFELRGRPLVTTRIAAIVWAIGWATMELSGFSQAIQAGSNIVGMVLLALWTLVGSVALIALAWAAVGKPEILTIEGNSLHLRRGLGLFGRTHQFDASAIRALRVCAPMSAIRSDYIAIRAFWDRGAGRVAFDVDGRTYAFGPSLDDAVVYQVFSAIASRVPAAAAQPTDVEPVMHSPARLQPGWPAHLTSWILFGALVIPARALLIDLPICTGGALGGPYDPIDRTELHANGRVILVPVGDFDADVAHGIADHFRAKYGLDIVVGSRLSVPPAALDTRRQQLDSDVLLSSLASVYPQSPERTIVIGLTREDMFIRDLAWRYAFSNRRPPRFAVVSPARMDHGCMGIRRASEATQLARLRKMIGKNIGVLFYGLPLSSHPRSMMYASIGGPQELDTMLEEF